MGPHVSLLGFSTIFLSLTLDYVVCGTLSGWEPCVPYQKESSNMTSSLPINLKVKPRVLNWHFEFEIVTTNEQFNLRFDSGNGKGPEIKLMNRGQGVTLEGGYQAQQYSWHSFAINVEDHNLQVSRKSHSESMWKVPVRKPCGRTIIQCTLIQGVSVVRDCPKPCIQDLPAFWSKELFKEGQKTYTLLLIPQSDYQLSFTMLIKNCLHNSVDGGTKHFSRENFYLKIERWNKLTLSHLVNDNHVFLEAEVDGWNIVRTFQKSSCTKFLGFKLQIKNVTYLTDDLVCGANHSAPQNELFNECLETTSFTSRPLTSTATTTALEPANKSDHLTVTDKMPLHISTTTSGSSQTPAIKIRSPTTWEKDFQIRTLYHLSVIFAFLILELVSGVYIFILIIRT